MPVRRLTDCVAEEPDQLMYIYGDELILLRDLGQVLIASCEGVVGWVRRDGVKFESLASSSSHPPTREPFNGKLPRTVLTAPSPPTRSIPLPDVPAPTLSAGELDPGARRSKRISGPFELESPMSSPMVEREAPFFGGERRETEEGKRESMVSFASSEGFGGIGGFMMAHSESERDSLADEVEELRGMCF